MSLLATQRALWRLDQTLDDPSVLNLAFGLLLEGPFDVAAMEWTVSELLKRHEPLRLNCSGPVDAPAAFVQPEAPPVFEFKDLSGLAPEKRTAQLAAACKAAARQRIDGAPLLRVECLLLEPDQHVLLMVFHHLSVDGWALDLFCQEAEQLYAARLERRQAKLVPLPAGQLEAIARDELGWLLSPRANAAEVSRRRELEGIKLPAVQPFGPLASPPPAMRRRVLGLSTTALVAWREFSAKQGRTLFPSVIAATALAICRYCQIDEVVLAMLVANRHNAAAQRVLGAHYGATALRLCAAPGTAVTDVMAQATDALLDATSNRLAFDTLAELLGDCAGANGPLVPTCSVVMDRYPLHRFALEDVKVSPISTLHACAEDLHADTDMFTPPMGDLVVFLRQYADTAALTVFWNPARIDIDVLSREMLLALEHSGAAFGPAQYAHEAAGGPSSYAISCKGWKPAVPIVDALSPLPLLTPNGSYSSL